MSPKDKALQEYLTPYLSEERKAVFAQVLQNRTQHVTVALENVYHDHNISAVLRSCEAFGLQDVHVITEEYGEYKVNPYVSRGAGKWLSVFKHQTTAGGIESLKEKGYKVVATSPHAQLDLNALNICDKTAFVFGAEATGASEEVLEAADETVTIPMFGFTESFNISVSVALCLKSFTDRLRASEVDWRMPEEIKEILYLDWTRKSMRRLEMLEKYFEKNIWTGHKKADE